MISRNSPCTCGSGKRYKHCCGSPAAAPAPAAAAKSDDPLRSRYSNIGYFRDVHRGRAMQQFCQGLPPGRASGLEWAPPGLLVIENYLDAETCRHWCEVFDRQETSPATVQVLDDKRPGAAPRFKLDPQRVTSFVPQAELSAAIPEQLMAAYRNEVTPYFNAELAFMTSPSALKYEAGGKYQGHADSEYWDMKTERWVRSMDRDFSVLLYLNDGYEGGTLYFRNFDLRLTPRPGMLVAFPSDHRFLHEAEPLLSGTRYVVVAWGAAKGVPKVNPTPANAIFP
jgi:predicted 2-oxoglutarate/Fe(II)-dependent dioxygenase YbiX